MTPDESAAPAVVLLSGGMDSTVLLHHVAKELRRAPLYVLSYNYGQRHDRELVCAEWQAKDVGAAEHQVVDISFVGPLVASGTTLVKAGGAVPDFTDLSEDQLDQPPTYVPNRNMMLLSIAAAYAESKGVSTVYYGAQAHDEYGYWDCTEGFLAGINALLSLNRRTPVTIDAPFVARKKSELVTLGAALGVEFGQTWSCYKGGAKACGVCPTCVERLKAFREAGATDPLDYMTIASES